MPPAPVSPEAVSPSTYLGQLLDLAPIGVATVDERGSIIEWNRRAQEIMGAHQELVEVPLPSLFEDPAAVSAFIGRSFSADRPVLSETFVRVVNGDPRHVNLNVSVLLGSSEGGRAMIAMMDNTQQVAAVEAREQILAQISFLADASRALASSLQLSEVFARMSGILLPYLADWFAIDLVDREGGVQRIMVEHKDPLKAEVAAMLRSYGPDRERQMPIVEALDSGRPQMLSHVTDEILLRSVSDDDHLQILKRLGTEQVIVVPLQARGRLMGTIMLVRSDRQRVYGPADLALAEEFAQRAALAMDNARLFQEHSYVARKLQESLLPPTMPSIPGIDIAARYCAAGEAVEVGGDFYDFFRVGRKGWGIVIGDVSGKGPDAAAITALARYTIRAAAMQVRNPHRMLEILNEAIMDQTGEERFATLVFARVETSTKPGPRKVVLSCGGHPLPLVLRNDGSVEEVGQPGMMLGLFKKIGVADSTVSLAPGETLLLYTDGVTEARKGDGLLGTAGLKELLAGCRGMDAERIAEHISQGVLELQDFEPKDDLAVVALRVPNAN